MAGTVKLYIYEDRLFHICIVFSYAVCLRSNYSFKSKNFLICKKCHIQFVSFISLGFDINKHWLISMTKRDFNKLIIEGKMKELKIEGGYF